MADQNDCAAVIIERLHQGFARVDIQMVGGFVQQHDMRRIEAHEAEQKPRFLATRNLADFRVGLVLVKAETGSAPRGL